MENGHVTEVGTNGGRMVILQRWGLMEGVVMLRRW